VFSRLCLFLLRLYKRKHIPANKNPKAIEPMMEPTMTDDFSDNNDGDAGVGDDAVGDNGDDVDGDVDGGDGSKTLVHLNSLLLLMSSNKISLSFN